jgi:tetratricopeptide (TPR) repeat protein
MIFGKSVISFIFPWGNLSFSADGGGRSTPEPPTEAEASLLASPSKSDLPETRKNSNATKELYDSDTIRAVKAELEAQLLREQSAGWKWMTGTLVTLLVVFIGLTRFQNNQEYKDAVTSARAASAQAQEAAKDARMSEEKAQERLASINLEMQRQVETFENKQTVIIADLLATSQNFEKTINEKLSNIDPQVNHALEAIEAKGNDLILKLIKEGEKQQNASVQFTNGLIALGIRNYKEAISCFEQASASTNVGGPALLNLGTVFMQMAKNETGHRKDELLRQAGQKFREATIRAPNEGDAWFHWGTCLALLAEEKPTQEACALLQEACEKFHKAVTIKPSSPEENNIWALVLCNLAEENSTGEAEALLIQAGQKFEEAVTAKPDCYEAWLNWGVSLADRATRSEKTESAKLFEDACNKYEKAAALRPNSGEVWRNWGEAIRVRAAISPKTEANGLYEQACAKYAKATTIDPNDYMAWSRWGEALLGLIPTEPRHELRWFMEDACEKYERALVLNPSDVRTRRRVGFLLSWRALIEKNNETNLLFEKAYSNYRETSLISPPSEQLFLEWGNTHLLHAMKTTWTSRKKHLDEAHEYFMKAQQMRDNSACFNIACYFAVRGDKKKCRIWLEKAEKLGELSSDQSFMKLVCLATVRNEDWFKKLKWNEVKMQHDISYHFYTD